VKRVRLSKGGGAKNYRDEPSQVFDCVYRLTLWEAQAEGRTDEAMSQTWLDLRKGPKHNRSLGEQPRIDKGGSLQKREIQEAGTRDGEGQGSR